VEHPGNSLLQEAFGLNPVRLSESFNREELPFDPREPIRNLRKFRPGILSRFPVGLENYDQPEAVEIGRAHV
jgi:hypothetical protein